MKWRSGPPPSIGWWPASVRRNRTFVRWWNGQQWSAPAWAELTAAQAASRAAEPCCVFNKSIEWTDRPASWPKRSRT